MIITIIEGSLKDYNAGRDDGCISFIEPSANEVFAIARIFSERYGKTIVIEPEGYGE